MPFCMSTQYKMDVPRADRMRVGEIECGLSDLTLYKTPHNARFGYGPHDATDAAKRRSTQKICRSRVSGLSCTHKRPRINHRSHVAIQSPQARKPTRSVVCACRRRSYKPCQGGQYAQIVASRHWIASETASET